MNLFPKRSFFEIIRCTSQQTLFEIILVRKSFRTLAMANFRGVVTSTKRGRILRTFAAKPSIQFLTLAFLTEPSKHPQSPQRSGADTHRRKTNDPRHQPRLAAYLGCPRDPANVSLFRC